MRGALTILLIILSINFISCTPTCTEDDLKAIYTYCENLNSTRSLYWYYSDTCNSTGAPPPPNRVDNLPCDIKCDVGNYLPYGETECQPCQLGTYSVGGGVRFSDFSSWPQDKSVVFNHYCSQPNSYLPPTTPLCDGWVVNNTYLESGYYQSNVNTVLDIGFTTVKPGYLAFTYVSLSKSSSSGLKMQVNFNPAFPLENSVDFTYLLLNLTTPGTHHVRWAYYLGDNPSPYDYARIGYVEISGLALAENSCQPCPAGRYTDHTGSYFCNECDNTQYSDTPGSDSCTSCPDNTFAFLGSSSCLSDIGTCVIANDATAFYSECAKSGNSWSRTKFYKWNSPLTCDNLHISLPSPETVDCGECPPNTIPDSTDRCAACPLGTYSNQGSCVPSDKGSAALPSIIYSEWNSETFPTDVFTTNCVGTCTNEGWSFFQDYIGTYYVGNYVDMYLSLEAEFLDFSGSISFEYLFKSGSGFAQFQFAIDSEIIADLSATNTRSQQTFDVTEGYHTFTWYFQNANPATPSLDKNTFANIYSITMKGTRQGSASEQVDCPAGFYQDSQSQSTCNKCAKGTFTDTPNSLSCSLCPANTTAEFEGSSSCKNCPFGTESGEGSAYCLNPSCIWYTDETESIFYNLSPFSGQYQYVGNKEPYFTGYYVISYCGFVSGESFSCENSFICEDFNLFNPINPTVGYLNWASSVSISPMDDPYKGYVLEYRDGDSIGCPDNELRSVDIIFSCEMDVDKFTPLTLDESRSSDCHLVMTQANYYGCPICSADNFTTSEGDCVDGEMTVSYVKNPGIDCNGVMRDTTEKCGDIDIKIGLLLVGSLVIFILLAGLAILVVVIYQKNQRLSFKYKELQKSVASSVEMEDK